MDDFIIIAHRGASGNFPENTMLAFRQALAAGATWLELDVHLSADGELVVIHDEKLARTTNGTGLVSELPMIELQQLDAGQGELVPSLSEVLDLTAGKATVNIELKGRGTAGPVAEMLQGRFSAGTTSVAEILVSSLNEEDLVKFAERLSTVRVAPVAELMDWRFWAWAKAVSAWSVHVGRYAITQHVATEAKRLGMRLFSFTVNDQQTLDRFRNWGVDGVFTDYPEKFLLGSNKSNI